jgi:hypothetical protein
VLTILGLPPSKLPSFVGSLQWTALDATGRLAIKNPPKWRVSLVFLVRIGPYQTS